MTFLHVSLLAGSLLAIVPVALHMLGRRQPKALTFPAIRFVRQTAIQAQKGWAIKRWLLLSLRILLVLLAAVALASPRCLRFAGNGRRSYCASDSQIQAHRRDHFGNSDVALAGKRKLVGSGQHWKCIFRFAYQFRSDCRSDYC